MLRQSFAVKRFAMEKESLLNLYSLCSTVDFRAFVAPRVFNSNKLICRKATKNDLETILRIERQAFEFPWTRGDFEYCLDDDECQGLVVESNGSVNGYLFYEARNGVCRLLNCAVDELERRKGIGAFMLRRLLNSLNTRRAEVSCVVREKNVQAQMFLRSLGFRAVWITKGYYRETDEDAHRMIFQLDEWTTTSDYVRRRLLAR